MTMEMNPPAVSNSHLLPRDPVSCERRAVRGWTFGEPPPKVNATKRSFHTQMNWKIPNEAMAGVASGRTILRKIRIGPAPSTLAASISEDGSWEMKLCNKKIAKGKENMVCDSQMAA